MCIYFRCDDLPNTAKKGKVLHDHRWSFCIAEVGSIDPDNKGT